jgi:5-methylcytosine-specific restriction endonuclease McrA
VSWPKRPMTYVDFICANCGSHVHKALHAAGRARFCSRSCALVQAIRPGPDQEAKVHLRCSQCGQGFMRWRHDKGRRYCSMACRRMAERERKPETRRRIAATLAAWNANKRGAASGSPGVLSRMDVLSLWDRQPACVTCGQGRGIDHVIAMSRGGPNSPANLQTMCRTCNLRKRHADDRAQFMQSAQG